MSLSLSLGMHLGSSVGTIAGAIAITSPTTGASISADSLTTISGTFTGPVTAIDVKWDGVSIGSASIGSGTWSFAWTPTNAQAAASKALAVTATVTGQSDATDSITLTVVAVPGAIAITSPTTGASINANSLTTISGTFAGPVTAIDVKWDGVSIGSATVGSGTWSFAWTPTTAQVAASKSLSVVGTVTGQSNVTDSITLTVVWAITAAQAVLRVDSYAANATWTRPTNFRGVTSGLYRRAKVELWAPGAGGTTAGNGGGGGAYSRGDSVDVSGSTTWAIGGLTGAAADTNATNATFGTTVVVAAGGLAGSNGGTGGQAASCTGDLAYSGGTGGTGKSQPGGGSAGSAGAASGSTAGSPDGVTGVASQVGRHPGGGGGVSSSAGFGGGAGRARISYEEEAVAGFARLRGFASNRTDSSASFLCTNPSGVVAGDLLVLWVSVDGTAAITVTGWTELVTDANSTLVRASVFYRFATGTGDAPTITTTTSRIQAQILRYANAGTPEATITNGDSTNADPPSCTYGGGAVNLVWLACAAWDGNVTSTISAPPTGYRSWLHLANLHTTSGVQISIAQKETTGTATENPGAYTSTTEQWVAATVAIPYAA